MFTEEKAGGESPAKSLLGQFIAWLQTKDPTEVYSWSTSDACACGQFSQEFFGDWHKVWNMEGHRVLNGLAFESPYNFGALLDRAKALHENGVKSCTLEHFLAVAEPTFRWGAPWTISSLDLASLRARINAPEPV